MMNNDSQTEHSVAEIREPSTDDRSGGQIRPLGSERAKECLFEMNEVLGRKWLLIILYQLLIEEPQGFSQLKSNIAGISGKMLSDCLNDLEEAGLIERAVLKEKPIRVEYSLTERGQALEPVLVRMMEWAKDHPKPTE